MKHHWWQPLLIPFTLLSYIATLFILPIYKPSSIRWHEGCFELVDNTPNSRRTTIWGRPGGQSWGIRVIWHNSLLDLNSASLRVHERVHTLHGEWVNAVAHLVLVPAGLLLGGGWWLVGAIAIAQLAFGITYLGHFLFEWSRLRGPWYDAYLRIWTERIAYRIDEEYEQGLRPKAWGSKPYEGDTENQ